MKIVMVAPFAVYPKGTVSIRMLPIAKNLMAEGDEVQIVVPPYDNPSESGRKYLLEGVEIINARFVDLPIVKYPLTVFSMLRRILHSGANVVYVFKPKGYSGLVAVLLALYRHLGLYKSTRLVLDTDDWEGFGGFADFFKQKSLYPTVILSFIDFQERWIPKQVDAVTVASRALESKLLSEGINAGKIFYIPNGKPQRNFDVLERDVAALRQELGLVGVPVILLYTRFFEYRLERVVEVLKFVKQKIPDAKLLVIGKGEFGEERRLRQLFVASGLGDSVVFGGWINFNDIPKYLALGDVAIYPFSDTALNRAKSPGKLVELMASGRAIVGDRVGQIKECLVDGDSGLLVDHNDSYGFALAIVKVLEDVKLRNQLSVNSKQRINNVFNWQELTKSVRLALLGGGKITR